MAINVEGFYIECDYPGCKEHFWTSELKYIDGHYKWGINKRDSNYYQEWDCFCPGHTQCIEDQKKVLEDLESKGIY